MISRKSKAWDDIENIVKKIIHEHMGIEECTLESDLIDEIGMDSLDVVEFVMAIEEEFNIMIDDEAVEKMKTVGDIVTGLKELKE